MKDNDIKQTDFVTFTGLTGGRLVVKRALAGEVTAVEDRGSFRSFTTRTSTFQVTNTFDDVCTKFSLGVTPDTLGDNTGLTADAE